MEPLTPEARELVRRNVAQAPRLTAEQRVQLAELLRPARAAVEAVAEAKPSINYSPMRSLIAS